MPRPEFRPTAEQRDRVMRYVYEGIPNRGIADVIGVDEKTLAKHFATELLYGREIIAQELAGMLLRAEASGKKKLLSTIRFLVGQRSPAPPRKPRRRRSARLNAAGPM